MAKKRRKKTDKSEKRTGPGESSTVKKPIVKKGGSDDCVKAPEVKEKKRVSEVLAEQQGDQLEDERIRRKLLREAFIERDLLYKRIFGNPCYVSPTNYGPPSLDVPEDYILRASFKEQSADTANPGDPSLEEQHLAVLAYGPDPQRPYWTYVSAGLASPWIQTEWQQVSGFGCELMLKTKNDSPWAAQLLRTLAFYVFNHAGLLSPGVRVGLNGPVDPNSDSLIRNAFIWYADEAPDAWYQLPSGGFGIFAIVGITEAELQFADSVEEYGTWCIQQLLSHLGHGQVTDPTRACIMDGEDIGPSLSRIKGMADTFRQHAQSDQEPAGQDLF
ncbi:MAG: suppressor of fused domain protein [Candidatus Obscuribacterales bacterium]|nr:suppressor of fused domain protein [Candidatus Obscuribacterales bacterium]